jgi:hypothetical protein
MEWPAQCPQQVHAGTAGWCLAPPFRQISSATCTKGITQGIVLRVHNYDTFNGPLCKAFHVRSINAATLAMQGQAPCAQL